MITRLERSGHCLSGGGGSSAFVIVPTVVEFSREKGGTVRMHGEFAGFTEVDATDASVRGRDVMDHFDVLLSRRRNEEIFLSPALPLSR